MFRKSTRGRWKWLLVTALMIAAAGCSSDEPTTEQVRAVFEANRGTFEELRLLFAADVESHRLEMVSAAAAAETWCRDRRTGINCLDEGRWRDYSSKMQDVGIRRIGIHRETPGVYFHTYHSTWDLWRGEFRSRGVVHAPGAPSVTHDHDDVEERVAVGDGWYTFLIIDS